jgi:mannose-6-phosphate isomerase-like protein (cupin superfamily)
MPLSFRSLTVSLASLLVGIVVPAAAQTPAPAAPPPGSPATMLTAEQLAGTLQSASAKSAALALATIAVTDQYFIHEVQRSQAGPPAVHHGWTELHFILAGGGTLVTGGTLKGGPKDPESVIEGGVSHPVHKGDVIIIPPDTAHWYKQVDTSLTYLEVRFIAPPIAPAIAPAK